MSVAAEITAAEEEYISRGQSASLYAIPTSTTVAGRVSKEEMERLYKGTFSRKNSRVRYIYDEIRLAPRNSLCPLCAERSVSTLDHYLAQSLHPSLAVTPINLVPACSDCNKAKLDLQASNASEQPLHPYFDEADDERWLFASVVENTPLALLFFANPPLAWSDTKRQRVINHFQIFGLGPLYSTKAAEELVGIRVLLVSIATGLGPGGLRQYLADQAQSRDAVARNSWQGAMYNALRESAWFCEGGYESIPTP